MLTNSNGPQCPYCGDVQTDDIGEVISYWGESDMLWTCGACDQDFRVKEVVERHWESLKIGEEDDE